MHPTKNITRFTYETTSFQGWRLSLCRQQMHYTRYFSDRAYGGEQRAFAAALHMKNEILAALARDPSRLEEVFEHYSDESMELPLPRGLRFLREAAPRSVHHTAFPTHGRRQSRESRPRAGRRP